MKFALVDGQRQEAQRGLSGTCPCCDQSMIPRCGRIKVPHWAHKGILHCDPWWEETEWHRRWKEHFPQEWQEFRFLAGNGEVHIADVRTDQGCVIEFQRSPIAASERQSRDAFYKKLVWVVNATRLKTNAAQFERALRTGIPVAGYRNLWRVRAEGCRLLQEWSDSPTPKPVFFDFGDGTLFWFLAGKPEDPMYVGRCLLVDFIAAHLGKGPEGARSFHELLRRIYDSIAADYARLRPQAVQPTPVQPPVSPRYFIGRKFRF
jgi:competence protein CoiA